MYFTLKNYHGNEKLIAGEFAATQSTQSFISSAMEIIWLIL